MIIAPEPLEEPQKKKILTLIGSEDFKLLRLLLESHVLELEAQSANNLAKRTEPANEMAGMHIEQAAAIRNFFKIIAKYEEDKDMNFIRISAESFNRS